MNAFVIAALLLVLLTISYQVGWSRSRGLAGASSERLHSRPIYHGVLVALFALLPAIVVLGLWALFSGSVWHAFILAQLPPETAQLSQVQLQAVISRVQALANGFGVVGEPAPEEVAAARAFETFQLVAFLAVIGAAAALGAGALFLAQRRIGARLRARTRSE
ncbi:MAG: phosphate ABC transporter permease family protein, partial [Alphaproteobacteria bacterium]